jgi:hypothetical protein
MPSKFDKPERGVATAEIIQALQRLYNAVDEGWFDDDVTDEMGLKGDQLMDYVEELLSAIRGNKK